MTYLRSSATLFTYVTMNYNNEFVKAMRKQLDQGRKAQFSMLIKCRKLELPIDIQCKLFESMVIPVVLYGCEIWGFQDIKMLEIFYRKFLKKVLKLRQSTSNCMVYREVGKLPLQLFLQCVNLQSSMCSWYKMFKKQLEFEKYLLNPNYGEIIAMCKLRCANIKLPVYNRIFMFDTDILCGLCN